MQISEIKENCSGNGGIKTLALDKKIITGGYSTVNFKITGLDLCFVNGLKRTILSDIVSYAIDFIDVKTNTSRWHNDKLRRKIQLIPVNRDMQLQCIVENTTDELMIVTTDDMKEIVLDKVKKIDDTWWNPDIHLVTLQPNQKIELFAKTGKNTPTRHVRYQQGYCYFRNDKRINILKPYDKWVRLPLSEISKENEKESSKHSSKTEQVIDADFEEKNEEIYKQLKGVCKDLCEIDLSSNNELKCPCFKIKQLNYWEHNRCLPCIKNLADILHTEEEIYMESVSIKHQYYFTIESNSTPPMELFKNAISVISNTFVELKRNMELAIAAKTADFDSVLDNPMVKDIVKNKYIADAYIFVFHGINLHTYGEIIKEFIGKQKNDVNIWQKNQHHPLDKEICITIQPKDFAKKSANAIMMTALDNIIKYIANNLMKV
jgi:DNA-directed RNA polymerase alpha subunit/DNA-directed RNA polymerase subunit L